MKSLFLLISLMALAPAALADAPQVYKWTDAQGVIHYSDKPPIQGATDLQAMDLPSLPAQDPAQIAAHQAQLLAEAQATQKLLQAQLDQQAQAAALAAQQAQLDAQLAAQQQPASQPVVEPIYVDSVFVPRAYRANLYIPHRHGDRRGQPLSQTAHSIWQKPH